MKFQLVITQKRVYDVNVKNLPRLFSRLLTGRPEEEASSFGGNLLKEMSVVHKRARKAMKSMFKALWSTETPPEGMAELANRFKGAQQRFELGKVSVCQEGAWEAWAMVKTRNI